MWQQQIDRSTAREVTTGSTELAPSGNGVSRTVRQGVVIFEGWYRDFKPHGEHGPALIHRHIGTGKIMSEVWLKHGEWHRERGPAVVHRDPITDVITHEEWYLEGKRHRLDGPAFIRRDRKTGQITHEYWYEQGAKMTPFDRKTMRLARACDDAINRLLDSLRATLSP